VGRYIHQSFPGGLDVTNKWNPRLAAAASIGLLGVVLCAGTVTANSAKQIKSMCKTNWPKQREEQRLCKQRHAAAADDLMKRIEAASNTSIEFAIAKTCIERATDKPPSTIDWVRALTCYENRLESMATADDP
jgi:hypothetical protein